MAIRHSLRALGERDFRLLYLGQAISALGDGLVPVALTFAVLEIDGSATALGLVMTAHTLPLVLFVVVGGVWADRLPRTRLMIGSDLVRGIAQATAAVLLISGSAEVWHLAALAAVYGSAEAFFRPAATGLIPQIVPEGQLQAANALIYSTSSLMLMLGPAVAGVLVAVGGAGFALLIDAGTFVVSMAFLALLRPRPRGEPRARAGFLHEAREGFSVVRARAWCWVFIVGATAWLFIVVPAVQVLGPIVVDTELGGAEEWGLVLGAFGAGTLSGGLLAMRWHPERPLRAVLFLCYLNLPPALLLAFAAPVPVLMLGMFLGGLGIGFYISVWEATIQQRIPPEAISRVSALDWMGSLAFMPLGFALVGPVSSVLGVEETLIGAFCAGVIITTLQLASKDVRNLRRLTPPERAILAEAEAVLP